MKKLFVILMCMLLVCGCGKETIKFSKEAEEVRANVEANLLRKSDKSIVVKFEDNDLTNYYVYNIYNGEYVKYLYVFHDNEEEYKEYLKKYEDSHYNLYEYEDAYITKITLSKGKKVSEGDIKKNIKKSLKDKKYTIIE